MCFQVLIYFKENNWAKLFLIAKFIYNHAINASIGYMPFKLNSAYHLHIFFKKDIDTYFFSNIANKLPAQLQNVLVIYCNNPHYTQKLQKRAQNKAVKPESYVFNNIIWLNTKYIKTTSNQKLKTFF